MEAFEKNTRPVIYRTPKYTERFRCIASDCRDSCCIGWEICIDEETLEKYKHTAGALFSDIRKSLSEDGSFCLTESGRCPHLLENGLCRIICEAGEDALCDVCREHPRFYNLYGDVCEWGISLACESAASLILESASAPSYTEEVREEEGAEAADGALFSLLFAEREDILKYVAEEKTSLEEKMLCLEKWAQALQDFIENRDFCKEKFSFCRKERKNKAFFTEQRLARYKEILSSLEPLAPAFPKRCATMQMPKPRTDTEVLFSKILCYFIYRYFLTYALEGDVTAPIGLALFSTTAIAALCEAEGAHTRAEIAKTAKDFSKEIEYSEENRDVVLDAFSAFA